MANVSTTTTVVELREIARTLMITGVSKLRKAELMLAIGDALYNEAKAEDNIRTVRTNIGPRKGLSTPKRLAVYGSKEHGGAKLTAKQWRRINKKIKRHFKSLA